jgi:PAS domain S-box-containing protein
MTDGPILAEMTPAGPAQPAVPGLTAIRALVEAASVPMAVFDAGGECLVANAAFVLAAAGGRNAAPAERRATFSPDGVVAMTLATWPDEGGAGRTQALIDAAANAVPLLFNAKDAQGRYLFVNRFQAAMFGIAPEDAIGKTADELIGGTFGSHTREIDAEVVRSGRPAPFYEERFLERDGTVHHLLTGKVPLVGPSGGVWGVATFGVDITDRMELERKLREAMERAELGSRAKSRFLGTMSHELRTPLNAVIGFAELMHEESLGPLGHAEYKEYAGLILRSGMNLLDMISNLLDFARADAGSLELSIADVEIGRLLRGVLTRARERMAGPSSAGRVTLEADLPTGMLAIRADEVRLRQVLRGLIDNAMKFTPAGGRVTVSARAIDGGGAELVVADTGIGMSPDELEHVFEPFWQADSGLGRTRDGAGIGLKLARQLVALHGGTLAMESVRGEGTRVILRLPSAPPPAGETRRADRPGT